MPPIVVCDASVALKWFHEEGEEEGEEEVEEARALLAAFVDRRIDIVLLDLTPYEIGNVLVRAIGVDPSGVTTVLDALDEISPPVSPSAPERALAARLSADRELTFYDAAYAAVAQHRGATLATMDRALLGASLGRRPSEILAELG